MAWWAGVGSSKENGKRKCGSEGMPETLNGGV